MGYLLSQVPFRSCDLDRYYEHYMDFIPAALQQPTSREVAAHILHGAVELNTRYPDPKGCLGINGVLAGSDDTEPIRRALIEARASGEASLRDRFKRAKKEGDLRKSANCTALAAFVCTILHGIAVQAKAGFRRGVLEAVVDQALSTWPSKVGPATGSAAAE